MAAIAVLVELLQGFAHRRRDCCVVRFRRWLRRRRAAAVAVADPRSCPPGPTADPPSLRRPASGQLVAAESRQRYFPAGVAQLVALVHPTSCLPWCGAPAVHTDHVVDRAKGEPTALSNAQGALRGLQLRQVTPRLASVAVGERTGPPVAAVTTTPPGHVYESGRGP